VAGFEAPSDTHATKGFAGASWATEGKRKACMKTKTVMSASAIALLLIVGALAKEITVEAEGRKVTIRLTAINHVVTESDMTKGSQSNAMACAFLFYSKLAKGDIPGAAKFASDSAAMAGRYQQMWKEFGPDAFKKQVTAFFSTRVIIVGAVEIGDETMLAIKDPQADDGAQYGAQYYEKKGEKYYMTDTPAALKLFQNALVQISFGHLAF